MKKVRNQSTQILILNVFSIAALLFMVFSLFCYNNVRNKTNVANSQKIELTYNANRFMNGSSYLTSEVRAYASTGKKEHYDNYWNEINNLKNRDIGIENMQKIGITENEKTFIENMQKLSNELVPLEEQAMKNVEQGEKEKAVSYVYGAEYESSVQKINELKDTFLEELDKRTQAEIDRLKGVSNFIQMFIYLSVIFVIVQQVFTNLYTKLQIIAPVVTIQKEMEQIAAGNLSGDFPLVSNTSEIGRLTEAIHVTKRELKQYIGDINDKLTKMAAGNMDQETGNDYVGEFKPIQEAMRKILNALNKALSDINHAAEQVSAGAEQVADSAQELSSGAVEQSQEVQKLSDSIGEFHDHLQSMAANADDARDCTEDARLQLEVSTSKMRELSGAIANISKASGQISGIIKIIEDIAFQTNILALNAAVEAARAGNAGKGFAVVADEVRNLAAKSSEAAKNTTVLIENMLSQMDQGTSLTEDTTNALNNVVERAQKSTVLVDEIATVTENQLEKLNEMIEGVRKISNVVETNAASAEQSAASAEELSGQAESMKESVNCFQLRQ